MTQAPATVTVTGAAGPIGDRNRAQWLRGGKDGGSTATERCRSLSRSRDGTGLA